MVTQSYANGTYQLASLEGNPRASRVNGYRLKKYYAGLMTVMKDDVQEVGDSVDEKSDTLDLDVNLLFAADHE